MTDQTSPELTQEQYAARIPKWCGVRTMQGHLDMMLCWSLCCYAERGEDKPESTCKNCDIYEPIESIPYWLGSPSSASEKP